MRPTFCKLALVLALTVVLTLSDRPVAAQCFTAAPVVSYYSPPVMAYAAPPPTVSYYSAPAVSYYAAPAPAPVVSYYAPVAPAPTVAYYSAPAPTVAYYAAPVVVAPAAVTTTYRYGLFGRRSVSYTSYYYP